MVLPFEIAKKNISIVSIFALTPCMSILAKMVVHFLLAIGNITLNLWKNIVKC